MTITPERKVVLSLRDWLAVLFTMIGGAVIGAVYVERRVSAFEHENDTQNREIQTIADNAAESRKIVNELKTVVDDLRVLTKKLETILDERKRN